MDHKECSTSDKWIQTEQGRLLARSWQPADQDSNRRRKSPIVLFHDSLGSIRLWRGFPAVLAGSTGREVIAYDRLGFGQSDRRTGKPGIDFIREEAESFFPALREQMGINRFIAFGHSVGGGMAVHCAALHPQGCVALITESAQAFVEERTRSGIIEAQQLFRQAEPFDRLERYHGERTRWVLDAWIETWLSPEFAGWSLKEVLARVTCPTLVIHGSEDEYGSNLHPKTIAKSVSAPVQLEIIPGARHVPHRENEGLVVGLVADFLQRHIAE